jgi:DUF177 domain-containing protein
VTSYPLRSLRLRSGEEMRDEVEIALEPFVLAGQSYLPVPATVSAALTVQRATTGDVFGLRFSTRLHGPCMRCLEDAGLDIDVRAREYQAADGDADDELRSDYVVDDRLELSTWARDAVAEAIPDQILCRPDCVGLCPVCGTRIGAEPHVHEEESRDPRWAPLEALRGDD